MVSTRLSRSILARHSSLGARPLQAIAGWDLAIIAAPMTEPRRDSKRTFSYDEAASLLPEVRRLTEVAQDEVRAAGISVSPDGGLGPALQEQLASIVQRWAQHVLALGLEVKGLWLVDFDNGSGYYCWRYPESGLHFYHSYEDGFRGRMRIQ